MNQITLIGTVSRDAETKTTQGGHTVAKFSIAVPNQAGKGKTFFRVAAWSKAAEAAGALYEGQEVAVGGDMRNNRYEKDGTWTDLWEVNATWVRVLGAGQAEERQPAPAARRAPAPVEDGVPF